MKETNCEACDFEWRGNVEGAKQFILDLQNYLSRCQHGITFELDIDASKLTIDIQIRDEEGSDLLGLDEDCFTQEEIDFQEEMFEIDDLNLI